MSDFIIIDARLRDPADVSDYVLLCKLPDNGVTPYVTWRSGGPNGEGGRYWGHYHRDLDSALADFKTR